MVSWIEEAGDIHMAERGLGPKGALHLVVESLGECGWDWRVWDYARQVGQRYGLAATVDEAKLKAEHAAEALARQLGLTA